MSYQVLARKWRPKTFDEVVGQPHVVKTIQNTLKAQRVGHAYLFTGTRGVGKTTLARLFAKALRCESPTAQGNPCLECRACQSIDHGSSLDFIEVDGASNNSVDNIRELIENVQYLPSNGKYKVYVIDEVHMLSVSAFNALLKTLEEPPAHVVFIFATTDPQKLLGTVISRCQRFDFKSIGLNELIQQVQNIAQVEGITFENERLISVLCRNGNGSLRDTLSLLDQAISLSSGDQITEESLLYSLGIASANLVEEMVTHLLSADVTQSVNLYKKAINSNVDLKKISVQILDELFQCLEFLQMHSMMPAQYAHVELTGTNPLAEVMWIYEAISKDFQWALASLDPEKNIQLSLSKISLRAQLFGKKKNPETKKKTIAPEVISPDPVIETESSIENIAVESVVCEPVQVEEIQAENVDKEVKTWENFLRYCMEKSKTIAINLERGNIIDKLELANPELSINIAFKEENHIFHDFLKSPEIQSDLKKLLVEYFEKSPEKTSVSIRLLSSEKTTDSFKSSVEIEEEKIQIAKEDQRQKLLSNKFILEAQNLFNSEVNKVILND